MQELLDKLEESKSQLAESRERLEDSLKRSDNLTAVSQVCFDRIIISGYPPARLTSRLTWLPSSKLKRIAKSKVS